MGLTNTDLQAIKIIVQEEVVRDIKLLSDKLGSVSDKLGSVSDKLDTVSDKVGNNSSKLNTLSSTVESIYTVVKKNSDNLEKIVEQGEMILYRVNNMEKNQVAFNRVLNTLTTGVSS